MKTIDRNGIACYPANIAFNKDTKTWKDKYLGIMFNFSKFDMVNNLKIYNRNDDSDILKFEMTMFNELDNYEHYLKGIVKIYVPVDRIESFKRYCENNFRYGPAIKGENEALDSIFKGLSKI